MQKNIDGFVVAISSSAEKGMKKTNLPEGFLRENHGLQGDAHADGSHRQVSLLAQEAIDIMRSQGVYANPGDFAENITTKGIELHTLPIGTRFRIGRDVLLELTQIGKECHSGCEISRQTGKCIMPQRGIFCRILKGGKVRPGDGIEITRD